MTTTTMMMRTTTRGKTELEVVRRLGAGSYAVVYLVREVFARGSHKQQGLERKWWVSGIVDELAFWGKGEEEVDLDLDEVDVFEGEDADAGWDLEGRKKGYGEGEDEKRWYGKEFAVKCLARLGWTWRRSL